MSGIRLLSRRNGLVVSWQERIVPFNDGDLFADSDTCCVCVVFSNFSAFFNTRRINFGTQSRISEDVDRCEVSLFVSVVRIRCVSECICCIFLIYIFFIIRDCMSHWLNCFHQNLSWNLSWNIFAFFLSTVSRRW